MEKAKELLKALGWVGLMENYSVETTVRRKGDYSDLTTATWSASS